MMRDKQALIKQIKDARKLGTAQMIVEMKKIKDSVKNKMGV
jgi:hypothetical protein